MICKKIISYVLVTLSIFPSFFPMTSEGKLSIVDDIDELTRELFGDEGFVFDQTIGSSIEEAWVDEFVGYYISYQPNNVSSDDHYTYSCLEQGFFNALRISDCHKINYYVSCISRLDQASARYIFSKVGVQGETVIMTCALLGLRWAVKKIIDSLSVDLTYLAYHLAHQDIIGQTVFIKIVEALSCGNIFLQDYHLTLDHILSAFKNNRHLLIAALSKEDILRETASVKAARLGYYDVAYRLSVR